MEPLDILLDDTIAITLLPGAPSRPVPDVRVTVRYPPGASMGALAQRLRTAACEAERVAILLLDPEGLVLAVPAEYRFAAFVRTGRFSQDHTGALLCQFDLAIDGPMRSTDLS